MKNKTPAPIKHSGPTGLLAGYDARKRKIASKSGGTVTAQTIASPGSHVPKEKARSDDSI